MLKKDIKTVKELIIDEKENGWIACDFDDYEHDKRLMSEFLGTRSKKRIEEALEYYYSLH